MAHTHVQRWETVGIVFIILVGATLHFVFEWSGCWRPIAWLAAVNESVGEHLKLALWPAVAFALAEYLAFGSRMAGFWAAKGIGASADVRRLLAPRAASRPVSRPVHKRLRHLGGIWNHVEATPHGT